MIASLTLLPLALQADPLAVGLKFGFLAVLYLFLLWVARSALREVRLAARAPVAEGTGVHRIGSGNRAASSDAWLVVLRGGGLESGERFDLFGGLAIGRAVEADIRIEDRFASGLHARVFSRGNDYYAEDLDSTNGTFINEKPLKGEARLSDLDEIRIGDTEWRFEYDLGETR